MIESCMRLVHVPNNQTITSKNAARSPAGKMAILLHGKCVNRSKETAAAHQAVNSEHNLHDMEEYDSCKSGGSTKRKASLRSRCALSLPPFTSLHVSISMYRTFLLFLCAQCKGGSCDVNGAW
jgi:hypothetical protein